MSRTVISVRHVDGELMLDTAALSLLLGVAPERISYHAQGRGTGVAALPEAWVRQGRRRAREAAAHTGSAAMLDGLRYWARMDHGADLEVAYQ